MRERLIKCVRKYLPVLAHFTYCLSKMWIPPLKVSQIVLQTVTLHKKYFVVNALTLVHNDS